MSEELKNVSAGQPEEEKAEAQALTETDLNQVAGGIEWQPVKTADGNYTVVPEGIPSFDNGDDAEKFIAGMNYMEKNILNTNPPPRHSPHNMPGRRPNREKKSPDNTSLHSVPTTFSNQ